MVKCVFDERKDCIAEEMYGECEIDDGNMVVWRCSIYEQKLRKSLRIAT